MNSKDFKKLQQQWYKKLARSGFKDIERPNDKDEWLVIFDGEFFRNSRRYDKAESTEKYYTLARQFLHEHVFNTSLEKRIWAEFSEGLSIVQIGLKLKIGRGTVYKKLKVLKKVCYGR
jgi:hypothetical protein